MSNSYHNIAFKEITLQDKMIISTFLQQENFMISDIAFGNLFIWRLARKIEFAIIENCLVIKTTYPNQKPFVFFPIGMGDKIRCIKILQQYFYAQNMPLEFHSLEKNNLNTLIHIFGNNIHYNLNRDRSDYIYNTTNLIHLSGRKYHKKKNHLNRFFQEYNGFTFEKITESNIHELQTIWQQWDNAGDDIGLQNESKGIMSALQHYNDLDFMGGLLRFDSNIIAFSFGEVISPKLCVIHIEKANTAYRGAYQAMNQQLLSHCFYEVKYVNREEDLGIEGLRKAKLSYHPDILLEKYEAIIEYKIL